MPDLKVNNEIYSYPDAGQEPGYGSDATGWAEAVTDVLDSLAGSGTINETQSIIENNILTNQAIAGLVFSSSLTKSATVFYRIERDTNSITPLVEQGTLVVVLNGSTWELTREISAGNPAGVVMDIDNTGQVVYTSTNLSGTGYVGIIKFKTTGILT